MRTIISIVSLLSFLSSFSQEKSNQIIKDFGIVYDLEGVVKPAKDQPIKVIIDLKTKIDDPEKINRGLDNIARMLNLHAAGGISKENLQFAVAVHGGATPVILDDKGYGKKYGVANPNTELLKQLDDAGVAIYVCSQSMIARKYDLEQVDATVDKALSMLTVVTEKMNEGYNLMVFQ